jgi:hypothetical protein
MEGAKEGCDEKRIKCAKIRVVEQCQYIKNWRLKGVSRVTVHTLVPD